MENKCRIVLTRPKEWVNRIRSFNILVDGNKVGTIANGGSTEIWVEPGVHKLSAKVDWCSSRDYPLQSEPGKTSYLRVKNGMKYYMLFIIPLLAALLVNLYYSFSNISRPAWFIYILIIGGIPAILYLGYYLTVGRKDYLVIDVEPTFTPS